ncbi:transmembrane protein 41B isoform X2 [Nerophis ophidion]|uniref:transmembrane protein 41B isoform X2 n=1 Tax=Nerophis ophidion TaxID=159077 RepID=UPI002ADF73B9|nr:transmembrane protein 41B isoform X2 [Nerophis ophidion]
MATKRGDKRNIDGSAVSKEELVANAKDSTALNDSCPAAGGSARMSLLILLAVFTCSASVMYLVYRNFPELPDDEMEKIKIPKDMDDAKALGTVLSKYKDTYYSQVLLAYFATYVFLQTFAIPGSIFLSILSGYLYPFPLALFLVCLVDKHRDHLINYIIFLRITPFLPNWFINITSPVINVPLRVFFIGTFLGVAPPSFVAINAGTTLYKLTTAGEAVSWNSLAVLGVLAVLSILPVCFQKKLQRKLE